MNAIFFLGFLSTAVVTLPAIAIPATAYERGGKESLARALLSIPGAVLIWAWVPLYLGATESVWGAEWSTL